MSIHQLLLKLKKSDIVIRTESGQLKLHAPEGALTEELLAELKANKQELIRFLNSLEGSAYTPIPLVPVKEYYPLSHAQRRLWIQEEQMPGGATYKIVLLFRMIGPLHIPALAKAFNVLLSRHESLRTVFATVAGEPQQRILTLEETGWQISVLNFQNMPDQHAAVNRHVAKVGAAPVDLAVGPLFQADLLQLDDNAHLLLLSMHHIVSDAWSMKVMMSELLTVYNSLVNGEDVFSLPVLRIQYKDYATWQLQEVQNDKFQEQRRYWIQQLGGELPILALPTDKPRPAYKTFRGIQLPFTLETQLSRDFNNYLGARNATLFMGLLALVKTLLYSYTGQQDIIIGTPVAGRGHPDLEDQIGYYLNTLALRTTFAATESFEQLLFNVKKTTLDAFSNQDYPFDLLLEELDIGMDVNRQPLFDVVLILENEQSASASPQMEKIVVAEEHPELHISKGDLRFQFVEQDGNISGSIEYNTDLYDRPRIEQMVSDLHTVLSGLLQDPDQRLRDLLHKDDTVLLRANFTRPFELPPPVPLITVIEEQVSRNPDGLAVEEENSSISYVELSRQSNRLSHLLYSYGLTEVCTGVCLGAGIGVVTVLLGCIKSGSIYMPVDLSQPPKRLQYLLRESRPGLLITTLGELTSLVPLLEELDCRVPYLLGLPESSDNMLNSLSLDVHGLISISSTTARLLRDQEGVYTSSEVALEDYESAFPAVEPSEGKGGYIFYTSGSTGHPKGIRGRLDSLSHYIGWHTGCFGMNRESRISQLAPVTFDASLKDILSALYSGGTLCVPSAGTRQQIPQLLTWLSARKVTVLQTVPTLFRLLTRSLKDSGERLSSLRHIVLAGERLYGRDVENWQSHQGRGAMLSNLYGLTETTILKSCYHITETVWGAGDAIPVGFAMKDAVFGVLDGDELCGIGEIGEVYIRSPYMSGGYLDESLNGSLFVQNPLLSDRIDMVCRTGDIGRYRVDGSLELLGRRDDQVKLHGVRVELDGVKRLLLRQEGIEQVELLLHQDEELNSTLLCYYTGRQYESTQLRHQLEQELPAAHLPGHYIWLEEFPLNVNGKVDRKRLPRPDSLSGGDNYEAPHAGLEQELSGIWQQILGVDRISRTASFFVVGGSSLKAIQLLSRIYKEYEVQLTIADIFKHTTLAAQAAPDRGIDKGEL
ncbi:condensation domain-containing protein [Chitinophaga sp. MD30]|uniref:non-ribosomal peptide synthetase n=1 Tax=Chitinophaga sp. MD30 TaxID=2033437 RepID=UPI000BAFB324|nr:condensation domain-containing protein [Chitinophaga sp. MD30]ASZ13285.1 hypothetical protein CK934_21140 [Chitinophaga sp. MD30]